MSAITNSTGSTGPSAPAGALPPPARGRGRRPSPSHRALEPHDTPGLLEAALEVRGIAADVGAGALFARMLEHVERRAFLDDVALVDKDDPVRDLLCER